MEGHLRAVRRLSIPPVAAALVHRAVGDRLTCIYVDHGLMRKRESELLRATFAENLGMHLVMVDCPRAFLARLAGVTDPEQKRRIIGDEFIRVFEEEAEKLGQIDFLTQGTLYPDVIESATSESKAARRSRPTTTSAACPADLRFKLIEPLRYLFKDEVRAWASSWAARADGPAPAVPGPGLAIRIIGEVTAERLDTLREADWIVIDEIKAAGLYRNVWQSFADPHAHQQRGRDGGWSDVRERGSNQGGDVGGRHDRGLGQAAVRSSWQDQQPNRERGTGGQSRCLRHLVQATRHDRVGVGRYEPGEQEVQRRDHDLPVVLGNRPGRGRHVPVVRRLAA
jgi:GMP synthase (glutamine-hydrolysing) B subunit